MNTNLSISSWNVNGLGDKCKDDLFLSCMKYDINILLETWKGTDANFNIPDLNILQKCRKKQRRSKRFSGGIVILYKSKLHKGIYELQDMSTSKYRIWLKLDKVFFGLEKDLFICACYIPPVNSPYYDDDFLKLETEISQVYDKGNILLIGDLNARIANRSDFIENEDELCARDTTR
jgi:exonuclease III